MSVRTPFAALVLAALLAVGTSAYAQEVSTMGSVNRSSQNVRGFEIVPAYDLSGFRNAEDLAPVQVFELVNPGSRAVTIGRLNTSCSCIELRTVKRQWQPGERILFELHNIRPTPAEGWNYSFFIQVTSPVRATLRYDLFLKSDFGADVELRPVEPMLDAGPGMAPIPQPQPTGPATPKTLEDRSGPAGGPPAADPDATPDAKPAEVVKAPEPESKYAVHKDDEEPPAAKTEEKTEEKSEEKTDAEPAKEPEPAKEETPQEKTEPAKESALDKPAEWI